MLDPPPHLSHALSSMYELMHRCMKKKKGKEKGYLKVVVPVVVWLVHETRPNQLFLVLGGTHQKYL